MTLALTTGLQGLRNHHIQPMYTGETEAWQEYLALRDAVKVSLSNPVPASTGSHALCLTLF